MSPEEGRRWLEQMLTRLVGKEEIVTIPPPEEEDGEQG
jgi:hypothetical protein